MKKALLFSFTVLFVLNIFAQQMHVKKFNLTSFNTNKKISSELLNRNSTPTAKQHPEYGILPYNAQCNECVELIDKRTIDSRLFIDPKNEGHTYSQKSFFPLHYKKNEKDIWRTIDPRLRQQSNGVYVANDQPVPTKCDLNTKSTSLYEKGFDFEFNKHFSLYFFDDNTVYTQKENGNYSNYSIGEEGLNVKNIWSGIDMEQIFTAGQIKTNFIIAAPLTLPVTKGWMVIEDHFTLPENISIVEEERGSHLPEGYYRGDYLLKNEKGETLITYEKPVYIDAKVFGMHGIYNLLKNGNDYTLQTLVPVEWLAKTDNTYPLMIDPTVYGATKMGDFTHTGLPSANMAFTSMQLGSCDYHMDVTVPGKRTLANAYVDLEYQLTYDNTCGIPPLPPPFCTFNMVTMEVHSDDCNTSTGLLSCNPAQPPYTGTCTTDSNLVPGSNALLISNFVPNYLSCLPPQCPDYHLGFTLRNRDSICGDMCGYLCARGNMWRMTIEANRDSVYLNAIYISVYGDTLLSSQANHIQWYYNGNLLPGETNQFLIATQSGTYSVASTTDLLQCSLYSITFTGITELSEDALIRVFPNPAITELNITTGGKPIQELRIFGVDGKLVISIKQPTNTRFDIKNLGTGVYIAEVKLKGITRKIRWVKM